MIKIPDDIQDKLEKPWVCESIPERVRSFYRKWLRYYFGFCHKSQHDVWYRKSFNPFIEKLAEKKQSAKLRRQELHAVSIFSNIVKPIMSRKNGQSNLLCKQRALQLRPAR